MTSPRRTPPRLPSAQWVVIAPVRGLLVIVTILLFLLGLGFTGAWIADGAVHHFGGGPTKSAPSSGPSDNDIRAAANVAVASRYTTSAGYKMKAEVDEMKVIGRQYGGAPGIWSVRAVVSVHYVPVDPNDDPRQPGKGESTPLSKICTKAGSA